MSLQDGIGEFFFDNDTKVYWVSFLDGMQRVLLFTLDLALATMAQEVCNVYLITVKPALETISIKRPPALRDPCSDSITLLEST